MKMIRHHANSKNSFFSSRNITLIVLVAVCLLSLLYSPIRNSLTGAVYVFAPSVWEIGNKTTGMGDFLAANLASKEKLVKENQALLVEMDRMQAQVLDRNLLAERVTKLEEALGRMRSDNRVVAEVVVGPGRSPYDTLVIDAGLEEGIKNGDAVVYAGSSIIGEIIEASPFYAKVKLYSSPGEEHLVIVGTYNLPVTAFGRGMGNFEAKVPQDSAVVLGDNVVSVKGGLILSTVSLIEEKPAEPFKRVFFREPFNITEIRSVEVVVNAR